MLEAKDVEMSDAGKEDEKDETAIKTVQLFSRPSSPKQLMRWIKTEHLPASVSYSDDVFDKQKILGERPLLLHAGRDAFLTPTALWMGPFVMSEGLAALDWRLFLNDYLYRKLSLGPNLKPCLHAATSTTVWLEHAAMYSTSEFDKVLLQQRESKALGAHDVATKLSVVRMTDPLATSRLNKGGATALLHLMALYCLADRPHVELGDLYIHLETGRVGLWLSTDRVATSTPPLAKFLYDIGQDESKMDHSPLHLCPDLAKLVSLEDSLVPLTTYLVQLVDGSAQKGLLQAARFKHIKTIVRQTPFATEWNRVREAMLGCSRETIDIERVDQLDTLVGQIRGRW